MLRLGRFRWKRNEKRVSAMTDDERLKHLIRAVSYLSGAIIQVRGMVLAQHRGDEADFHQWFQMSVDSIQNSFSELQTLIADLSNE